MSTIEVTGGGADERVADEARDALAHDLASIAGRARIAVGTAESIAVRGTSIAPFVAAGIGVASVAAFAAVGDPATVKAAEALVGPIDDERKAHGGQIAHYTMSAVAGLVYELVHPLAPLVSAGHGMAYGAAVWALADEAAVPALGLAEPPWRSPIRTHARALLAHLVYGAAVDLMLRGAHRALG